MLALWSSTTKALGHHVTRILLEVFKDWTEDEVTLQTTHYNYVQL